MRTPLEPSAPLAGSSYGPSAARFVALGPLTAVAVLLAACSSAGTTLSPDAVSADAEGDVFLVQQSEEPNAFMEALFVGRIAVDTEGCLRLETNEDGGEPGATVVWRPGFRLDASGGSYRVRGPDGAVVGTLGGEFRLGGGFVQTLGGGIPMTDEMRNAALQRCPGDYWLVGSVAGG